jgi:hypothetical protein
VHNESAVLDVLGEIRPVAAEMLTGLGISAAVANSGRAARQVRWSRRGGG